MKKRKVLAMLLAFAMTFSLAACGSSGGNDDEANSDAVVPMRMPFRIMRSQVIRVQKMLLLSGRGTQILRPCRTY